MEVSSDVERWLQITLQNFLPPILTSSFSYSFAILSSSLSPFLPDAFLDSSLALI